MKLWFRYAGMIGAVAGGFVLLATLLLPADDRRTALWLAAGVAVGVQLATFALFLRFRGKPTGFLGAWLAGTAARVLAMAGVGAAVWSRGSPNFTWTLLALTGLFFVLHLLEPLALRGGDSETGMGTKIG
jgi:hypothetical protein